MLLVSTCETVLCSERVTLASMRTSPWARARREKKGMGNNENKCRPRLGTSDDARNEAYSLSCQSTTAEPIPIDRPKSPRGRRRPHEAAVRQERTTTRDQNGKRKSRIIRAGHVKKRKNGPFNQFPPAVTGYQCHARRAVHAHQNSTCRQCNFVHPREEEGVGTGSE